MSDVAQLAGASDLNANESACLLSLVSLVFSSDLAHQKRSAKDASEHASKLIGLLDKCIDTVLTAQAHMFLPVEGPSAGAL